MTERKLIFGARNGAAIPRYSQFDTIRLRGGAYLDKIEINNEGYGGDGGHPTPVMYFAQGEYISDMTICSNEVIDRLVIKSSNGHLLDAGGTGGTPHILHGRVTGISGEYGKWDPHGPVLILRLYIWLIPAPGFDIPPVWIAE